MHRALLFSRFFVKQSSLIIQPYSLLTTRLLSIDHYHLPHTNNNHNSNINIPINRMSSARVVPTQPKSFINEFGLLLRNVIEQDMDTLLSSNLTDDEARDTLFRKTRAINKRTSVIQFNLRTGQFQEIPSLLESNIEAIYEVIRSLSSSQLREGNLSNTIERFTENRLLFHFYVHGYLANQADMQPCNDEEYIGAVLSFAQEVARYALSRGCEADVASIKICKDLLFELNGKMLEFSFRNGPLRRKFDALKYAYRNVENIEFDLSMVPLPSSASTDPSEAADCPPATKKLRGPDTADAIPDAAENMNSAPASDDGRLLNTHEFDTIRARMDAVDALREDVIKQCRTVQKNSKLAIYSVQRGALSDAEAKLSSCADGIKKLLELIEPYPALRQGAVSNCIEEWGEGYLLLQWVKAKTVLSINALPIRLICSEYIGALSDFTGEIGRLAVAAATKRDKQAVLDVLQADTVIFTFMNQLNVSGQFFKKCDAVSTNLRKAEELVYELSLQEYGGRGKRLREEEPAPAKDENGTEN